MTFNEASCSLSVQIIHIFYRDSAKLSLLMLHSVNPRSLVLPRDGEREEGVLKSLIDVAVLYVRKVDKAPGLLF